MSFLISLSALFLSAIFIQVGGSSLGPLDALVGHEQGFSASQIGLLGSAHFFGLLIGGVTFPYIIRHAGHARCFAVTASLSAIATILHPIYYDVGFWCILRIITGFSIAGGYTVIESWLHAKLVNANRGRGFAVYRLADMSGTLIAQSVVAALDPASYVAYNIIAIVGCLSLLPLALTRSVPPELPKHFNFKPFFALQLSPLAGMGVVASGMTNAAFRMVGPVYALEIGLNAANLALFLVMGVLGGAVSQIPAGYIADRFNRRVVLIGFSFASIVVCVATGLLSFANIGEGGVLGFVMVFLFGMATVPIYSVSATHANDFAQMEDLVPLSASLLLLYAIGAIVSPVVCGFLIEVFNAGAMFLFIAMLHVLLVAYSIWRMSIRPALASSSYRYVPRTSLFINFFLRNTQPNTEPPATTEELKE